MPRTSDPVGRRTANRAAREIADAFSAHADVRAITLGGSHAAGTADAGSDLDLYLYASSPLAPDVRAAIVAPRARRAEIDNRYWEVEDDWIERDSGLVVEVIHRDPSWLEAHLHELLDQHRARLGYTTTVWHGVLANRVLYDPDGWFTALQERVRVPYPGGLATAVLALNLPLLTDSLAAYPEQVRRALERGDRVAAQHRITALLASYFDVLFAANRTPHPGEKRLFWHAARLPSSPTGMRGHVGALLDAGDLERTVDTMQSLVAALAAWLVEVEDGRDSRAVAT